MSEEVKDKAVSLEVFGRFIQLLYDLCPPKISSDNEGFALGIKDGELTWVKIQKINDPGDTPTDPVDPPEYDDDVFVLTTTNYARYIYADTTNPILGPPMYDVIYDEMMESDGDTLRITFDDSSQYVLIGKSDQYQKGEEVEVTFTNSCMIFDDGTIGVIYDCGIETNNDYTYSTDTGYPIREGGNTMEPIIVTIGSDNAVRISVSHSWIRLGYTFPVTLAYSNFTITRY